MKILHLNQLVMKQTKTWKSPFDFKEYIPLLPVIHQMPIKLDPNCLCQRSDIENTMRNNTKLWNFINN